jgi:hypothetical protein
MRPVIFLGPTLPRAEAEAILVADYRPPAALADVWRAAREHPQAIGIIDGYFHSVPSVWHKEILWALGEGVAVFGAASMGALRAAELDRFGMVGIGRIYEAYAAGELEDDDEVALAHADASEGFRPASEPMVNIRATLARGARDGILSGVVCARLEAIAKGLYYPERIWSEVFRRAREEDSDDAALRSFEKWLPSNRVNQKRADAVALLEAMRGPIATKPPAFHFEETVLWRTLLERDEAADNRAVVEELKLKPELFDKVTCDAGASTTAVLASLRRLGAYELLLENARRKGVLALEAIGRDVPEREALLRWFFEERLGGWPDDLPGFLRARGWVSDEVLAEVAEREFRTGS